MTFRVLMHQLVKIIYRKPLLVLMVRTNLLAKTVVTEVHAKAICSKSECNYTQKNNFVWNSVIYYNPYVFNFKNRNYKHKIMLA